MLNLRIFLVMLNQASLVSSKMLLLLLRQFALTSPPILPYLCIAMTAIASPHAWPLEGNLCKEPWWPRGPAALCLRMVNPKASKSKILPLYSILIFCLGNWLWRLQTCRKYPFIGWSSPYFNTLNTGSAAKLATLLILVMIAQTRSSVITLGVMKRVKTKLLLASKCSMVRCTLIPAHN